jgi:Zn-finger nucleic acid-binding protein
MRLLVACSNCRRQYDATRAGVGAKVRCRCGAALTVTQPRGHDAAVVRCSSCGAPREAASPACGHCAADFTIHETDLHTVCPGCLARISDRARFCHHCGQAVTAADVAGTATSLPCPACDDGPPLFGRRLGALDIAAAECRHCAGLWLGSDAFEHLKRHVQSELTSDDALADVGSAAHTTVSSQAAKPAWRYRKCPACGQMMQRRNYGRMSGVIVDVCKSDGIWFDADELHRILSWIREGGLDHARREVARQERHWEATLASQRRSQQQERELLDDDWPGGRGAGGLFGLMINAIFRQ